MPEGAWHIPQPLGIESVVMADGGIILLRRHGNPDGPRLVLSHGNALSANAYLPFWSLLLNRFDIILHDQRNHGLNPLGDEASHNLPMMVWDNMRIVREIDRVFGAKPKIGVYHSLSAMVAILQAFETGGYAGLVLFDPPICPPNLNELRLANLKAVGPTLSGMAMKRKAHFETVEELAEIYRRARFFKRLLPGVPDLMARTTLRPAEEGGYELCCPPGHEAHALEELYKWQLALDLDTLGFPVKVIGADPMAAFSFLPSVDPRLIAKVDYDFVPDATHMLQLEEPEACVALMLDFLTKASLIRAG